MVDFGEAEVGFDTAEGDEALDGGLNDIPARVGCISKRIG